jgi:hypothetical protein
VLSDQLAEAVADLGIAISAIHRLGQLFLRCPRGRCRFVNEPTSSIEQMPIPYALRRARLRSLVSATRIAAPWTRKATFEASAPPKPWQVPTPHLCRANLLLRRHKVAFFVVDILSYRPDFSRELSQSRQPAIP